jgi:hypothetical protein
MDLTCQHKNHTLLVEGPEIKIHPVGVRQWSVRERFGAEDFQTMINLYISGATRSQVAQRFGISVSSVNECYANTAYADEQQLRGRGQARELEMIFIKIAAEGDWHLGRRGSCVWLSLHPVDSCAQLLVLVDSTTRTPTPHH